MDLNQVVARVLETICFVCGILFSVLNGVICSTTNVIWFEIEKTVV